MANAQESIEEEQDSKAELQKQLVNAKSEAANWKNKFDSEATPRIEELEDAKYVKYSMFINWSINHIDTIGVSFKLS